MIPALLHEAWRAQAAVVTKAGRRAIFCAPFAVWRAWRAGPVSDVPSTVRRRVIDAVEYLPPLYRLLEQDRWMETVDDVYLPAGLYEDDGLHRKAFDRGLHRTSAVLWLWRNRAYGAAAAFKFEPEPSDEVVIGGAATAGDPETGKETIAGLWSIVVRRGGVPVAFQTVEIGFYPEWVCKLVPALRRRFWMVIEGWKLRDFYDGDGAAGEAAGILQVRSLRPFQARGFPR